MKRLLLLIVSLIAALPGAGLAQTANTRGATQGFSVVLLLGDGQSGPAPEGLSDAARKALADMKDFLPYRSYRILDNQWITAGDGSHVTTRVRGMNAQELDLQMRATPRPNGLDVTFHLGDGTGVGADSSAAADKLGQARARAEEAERAIATARERYSDNHPRTKSAVAEAAIARVTFIDAQRAVELLKAASAPLIDTSFSMAVGETVIVGTSRVQGDQALIVVLTAVARGTVQPTASRGERSVMILGEISMPGKVTYEDGMTVQQVIERVGGVTGQAADRREIRRTAGGSQQTIEATATTPLLPNDIVYIPRRPRD
jgi:hypothetical protein